MHLFKNIYLFIFRDWGREGEREGEKHQCVVASHVPPTGDPVEDPGMCPDWESNWRLSGSQAHAQSTEPHQPGCIHIFFKKMSTHLLFFFLEFIGVRLVKNDTDVRYIILQHIICIL